MKQFAIIALAFLSNCDDETISGYASGGAVWQLETINGVSFDARATLTFPELGKIVGEAPCNGYFGEQTAPYPWFEVKGIASTKRTCADLNAESAFFDALGKMTLSEVAGSTLILSTVSGDEMVFRATE